MLLSILTPDKKLLESVEVEEMFVPGIEGTLNILKDHSNFVTVLETGVMRWKIGNTWDGGALSHGFLEIFDGHVSILAETAELGANINLERAKAALEKAQEKIKTGGLDDANFEKYQLKLERAASRIDAHRSPL